MSAELLEAYLGTRYRVLDDEGALVAEASIGETSAGIDAVLARHGASVGVFITAWNPRSEITDACVNEAAHTRMADELAGLGVVALPHLGVGADPSWSEHGFLVLDLAEADAVRVATAYGQNAVVVVELGERARLVTTPVMPGVPPTL